MGEVFLSAPAPAGGALVKLSSNSPFASVPKKVWVYDRESSATFNITTKQVTSLTTVTISATYGVTVSASLSIVVSAKLRLDTGLVAPPRTTTLPGTVPANPQFTDIVGGASPAPLNLQITTSNGQPWSTYDTSPWFDARPTFGASGGITTLYPHTANLGAGTYTQPIRISTPGVPDLVVTVTLVMTASTPQPPSGLVAAYGFNEGTGTSVADATGNDHTGNISGATWSTQGKFGNALSFDGINDWATINSTALLNLTTGMTVEAWVFPTSTRGVRDILIKEGSKVDIYNLYARNGSGRPESNGLVGGVNRAAEGAALPANVWTHVAGTYDGSTLRLFINGVEVGSTAITGSIATSNGSLRIGGNSLWGEFFQGRIDEIRIYNRALNAAGIQVDMNAPVGGVLPDPTPPSLSAVSVSPTSVVGGSTSQATVTLSAAAPSGGAVVSLASSNTGVAIVPGSLTVPSGAMSATFTASTVPVSSSTSLLLSGSYGGVSRSALLTVNSRAVTLSAISLIPTSLIGGSTAQGTATLSGPAPAGGAIVPLSSSNVAAATMPASVTVPAASTSATFTISTSRVSALTSASLSGSYGGVSRSASLTVNPTTPSGGITVNPANPQFTGVVGGAFPAPLNLQITTPNGQPWSAYDTSPWFDAIPTSGPSGGTTRLTPHTENLGAGTYRQPIRISSAGLPDLVVNVTLVMTSSGTPQPTSLSAVSVAPTTVIGGTSSQGTVTLTGAAPAGGVVVSLSSTNPSVARVPASVTVPAGSTSATCTVTTSVVTSNSQVTVSASYAGLTRGTGLMVQSAGSPPPTGCPGFVIEGFGRDTVGGCGGTVYTVTNLNDSGPGSLRDFVNRTGPRIIRFEVSGTVALNSPLSIGNPFITIDGSTAPNGGIAIKGGTVGVSTDNVILRYIRIRPGDVAVNRESNDALQLGSNASNIVVDHCSFSWSTDGLTDLNAGGKVTVQWSIMSEQIGGSGAVLIFSYADAKVSFHHNLLANNGGARNPELGRGDVDWVNNVIYRNLDGRNWYADGGSLYFSNLAGIGPGCSLDPEDTNNYCDGPGGFQEGGIVHLNYVGNFFKPGNLEVVGEPREKHVRLYGARRYAAQSSAYFFGNIGPARPNDSLPQIDIASQEDASRGYLFPVVTTRHAFPQINTTSAAQAYIDVLAGAGARVPCLDSVDRRILSEVANGTGTMPQDGVPAGGWPDLSQPCPSPNAISKLFQIGAAGWLAPAKMTTSGAKLRTLDPLRAIKGRSPVFESQEKLPSGAAAGSMSSFPLPVRAEGLPGMVP